MSEPGRLPVAVGTGQVIAWYTEGMALFKRAPLAWAGLAACVVALELAIPLIPLIGQLLEKILSPLFGAGLLIAGMAAANDERPGLRHLFAIFRAPPAALAAIVATGLAAFAAEAGAVWWFVDLNLLTGGATVQAELTPAVLLATFAIGILATLPLAFVPFLVLFEPTTIGESFALSFRAFGQNTVPLLVYGGVALVLLSFGVMTMGAGLLIVFPIWATSSVACWRDIFPVANATKL